MGINVISGYCSWNSCQLLNITGVLKIVPVERGKRVVLPLPVFIDGSMKRRPAREAVALLPLILTFANNDFALRLSPL